MANQKRRDQISAAALELFDQRGYHATGMEDIAKAVGMRASSLYNHVDSKQELLSEIAIHAMEDLLRTNATALANIHSPEEQIVAAMRAHVIFHCVEAKSVRVGNMQLGNLEEPSRSIVLQLRRDYVSRWMNIVTKGVETGCFQAVDIKIVSWALIDMGIGVSNWFSQEGPYSAAELADMYGSFALRQLQEKS